MKNIEFIHSTLHYLPKKGDTPAVDRNEVVEFAS